MKPPSSLRSRPYLLINGIQHYAWGSRGQDAFIPRLLGMVAEPNLPYAELWIGTHPKAPSQIVLDSGPASLSRVISQHPLLTLGDRVSRRFSGTLPFLFKVLSVAEPLSIQVHPNKVQAQALHARDPEHYPDDNHKPELAIALNSLTALVGFRHPSCVLSTLDRHPELADFIGPSACYRLRQVRDLAPMEQRGVLRLAHSTLVRRAMTRQGDLAECVGQLETRLRGMKRDLWEDERLFLTLRERRARADVGLLSLFLLNPMHLEEGEGIFIAPGTLHAYLRGNIVECMANSDNVVRGGLTSKFQDFEAMVDILSYETEPVAKLAQGTGHRHVIYPTPAAEFQISRWRLKAKESVSRVTGGGPGILLITKGSILISWQANSVGGEASFRRGQSVFVPASLAEFAITAPGAAELFEAEVPL